MTLYRRVTCRLTIVLAAAGPIGCGGEPPESMPPSDFVGRALDAAITDTMVPTMTEFAEQALKLDAAVQVTCPAPTQADLLELQERWIALASAWSGAALYNLGPLNDDLIAPSIIYVESMRQRGIDYTETVRESIDLGIQSDVSLDPAYFQRLQFNRVGLLALEVLLFEGAAPVRSSTVSDLVAGFRTQPRRCEYLAGVSSLMAERAISVRRGWTMDFNGQGPFESVMRDGPLEDGSEALQALLLSVGSHLEYIERRKLNGILDMRIADAARPDLGIFYVNLARALREVDDILQRSIDGGPTFLNAMSSRGFSAEVEAIQVDLRFGREALSREDRAETARRIGALKYRFQKDIPEGLGVDLGLNFTDGD